MKKRLPIIIAGGGIGGIIAAIALARKGRSSIILEQAPEIRVVGYGVQFFPNVFKMFDYLGMYQTITDIAFFPDNLVFYDGESQEHYLKIPLGKEIKSRFKYPYGVFLRDDLMKVLVQESKKYSEIQMIPSAKVVGFEDLGDKVIVKTKDGDVFEGEALIGADGLWSTLRNIIVDDGGPKPVGQAIYRAIVPMDEFPKDLISNDVVFWVQPNGHLLFYKSNRGDYRITAECDLQLPLEQDDVKRNREILFEGFKNYPQHIRDLLPKIDPSCIWIMYERDPIAKDWYKGNAVLIGDAAHASQPHLIQGAGMAIEDAVVLAEKIAEFDKDYPRAFKAYQDERFARTGFVQLVSRAVVQVHHSEGIARKIRNKLLAPLDAKHIYDHLSYMWDGIEVPNH